MFCFRVDAIRIAEEERETLSAVNRINPLDEELIKTKGMLKAPSARREGLSRHNSTKRESRESQDISLAESSPQKEKTLETTSSPNSNDPHTEKTDSSMMQTEKSSSETGNPEDVKMNLTLSFEDKKEVTYSRCPDTKSLEDTGEAKNASAGVGTELDDD